METFHYRNITIMAILIYNNASVYWCPLGFFAQGMLGVKIAFPEVIVFKVITCHEPPLPHPQFFGRFNLWKIHQNEGKWVGLEKEKKKHFGARNIHFVVILKTGDRERINRLETSELKVKQQRLEMCRILKRNQKKKWPVTIRSGQSCFKDNRRS